MLPPARPASPSAPDSQQGRHRNGRGSHNGHPPPIHVRRGPVRDPRRIAGLFGLFAVLAALAFPLAPVHQPSVTYSWTAADGYS